MAAVDFAPILTTVAETIQTAIAPVFLLAGIGAFLNVLTGRLARVIDRARAIEDRHADVPLDERRQYLAEMRLIDRRMVVINRALMLAVTSAVAICVVVAMLFIAELFKWRSGREVAVVFIFAMAMLTAAFFAFAIEVRLSLRVTRVRHALIIERLQ